MCASQTEETRLQWLMSCKKLSCSPQRVVLARGASAKAQKRACLLYTLHFHLFCLGCIELNTLRMIFAILSMVSAFTLRSLSSCDRSLLAFPFAVATIKHHMALTSRGFQEKIGRFECLWSPFAALNYAEGSCERAVMIMQR